MKSARWKRQYNSPRGKSPRPLNQPIWSLKTEMHDCDAVIEYCRGHAIAHLITEQNKSPVQDITIGI